MAAAKNTREAGNGSHLGRKIGEKELAVRFDDHFVLLLLLLRLFFLVPRLEVRLAVRCDSRCGLIRTAVFPRRLFLATKIPLLSLIMFDEGGSLSAINNPNTQSVTRGETCGKEPFM